MAFLALHYTLNMVLGKFLPVVLLVSLPLSDVQGQEQAVSLCSPAYRLGNTGGQCVAQLREKARDKSAFHFNDIFARCTNANDSHELCYHLKIFPKSPISLSTLIFGHDDAFSGLDRYMRVTFTAPPGEFSGCDTTYRSVDTIATELDPLSDTVLPLFNLRMLPRFQYYWVPGELYTLIFLDGVHRVLHAAYVNIEGSNIENATVLKEYEGPFNPKSVPNIYTFLLFKQKTRLCFEKLPSKIDFDIRKFIKTNNLEGPVAANLIQSESNARSIEDFKARGLYNCASLVKREVVKMNPQLNLPFFDLSYEPKVHMRVRYTTDDFTYKCGSNSYITHPGKDFYLDPVGNGIVYVGDIRNGSVVSVEMNMNKINPDNTKDFQGKLYSLIVVDGERQMLIWMKMNIRGRDISTGINVREYRQPETPGLHQFYYLLYEQSKELTRASTAGFTENTSLYKRLLFGIIQAFISVNNLQLVGVSRFRATNDEFVQCFRNLY